ncbi:unnamed protein product [Brachionus calyciflorus]|uniref:Uncharacterized protein n=1 Tax=Brachionus calyciflorus TaxID=104777 RepID=A0A813MUJ5_9BILA|nr:unnamed protein product [Brachionus calyciflorus]
MKALALTLSIIFILQLPCFDFTAQEMVKRERQIEDCNFLNCRLPLCKCSNPERPGNIQYDDTPMMVSLSFNGVLTTAHSPYIKKILNPLFKNPNGCPIQSTFFISDSGNGTTDYCFVQTLFNNNNEISVSSPKYSCPYTDCDSLGQYFRKWRDDSAEENIFQQKKNIASKAKINKSFLRGFRVPFLDQRGNVHYKALKKYAFNYDSSVIISPDDIKRHDGLRLWPHTLDFPANYTCPTCPTKKSLCNGQSNCSMSSVWIVPLHYFNIEGKNPCPTLIKDEIPENRLLTKSCYPKNALNSSILYDFLISDFKRHYTTNKAPFVINLELSWFDKFGDMLTDALVDFITELTDVKSSKTVQKSDVYFMPISRIIEWIEYPAPLSVIASKWLWDCDGVSFDYDEECESIKKLRENSIELEEVKKKNKTAKFDLQTEQLFRNGILSSVILVFVFSIIFTILYDKYH